MWAPVRILPRDRSAIYLLLFLFFPSFFAWQIKDTHVATAARSEACFHRFFALVPPRECLDRKSGESHGVHARIWARSIISKKLNSYVGAAFRLTADGWSLACTFLLRLHPLLPVFCRVFRHTQSRYRFSILRLGAQISRRRWREYRRDRKFARCVFYRLPRDFWALVRVLLVISIVTEYETRRSVNSVACGKSPRRIWRSLSQNGFKFYRLPIDK